MVNNKELFEKILKDHPPEFNIGEKVKTELGVGYIAGRVYNERLKGWKYTLRPYGLSNFFIDVNTVSKFD